MQFLWLLMGLLGAIWVFWDSHKQGQPKESSVHWAIGSFFLPVVVIPFYLLQSSFRKKLKRNIQYTNFPQDITSSMKVKCRHCNEFFQGNPDYCPYCGISLKE